MVINTNYLALVSQNNLNRSQSALGSAIERLSSGLRINSAKDDAAGQAIANRFTANIKGLTQAGRNANDGISIAQTTEGALNEMNNNLQRIRELSVQAANGTNSASDLQSIQAEIGQRLAEINRVSDQTQFNGVKVLADGASPITIQVGANDNENISISLSAINQKTLGLDGFNVGATSGPITQIKFEDANGITHSADISLNLSNIQGGLTADDFTLHGYGTFDSTAGTWDNYALKDTSGNMYAIGDATVIEADPTNANFGQVTFDFTDAAGAQAAKDAYDADVDSGLASTQNPLKAIDDALKKVDSLRSDLGAIQNRFESTIANLNNTITNLSAARSRIEDADYAVEVSNMTRAQILQQAGTAVLAQANQVPQTMLSLLR
ncbi:FliC/FljB family flagellin [Castellaniella ginsengisoli]|uniref:Flagellin n=1 Tax=Castellaniella ginsengisoli TaxID=546114 RepID=A0AB39CGI9_9BURK